MVQLCQHCQQTLLFENTRCERCGHQLGYLPDRAVLSAVDLEGATWIALASPHQHHRFCANWERQGCNWMVSADEGEALCIACRHNRTIPDISDPANHLHWRKIEAAKRRLIYSLIKLDLPMPTAASGDVEPLVFEFLSDPPNPSLGPKVMTGHDNGVITLSLAEADDGIREQLRVSMGEPYRTLLGHFRPAIIIGTGWCVTGVTSRTVEPSSATRVMTMRPRLSDIMQKAHPPRGSKASSALMRRHTLGRISLRPLRIISISSTRWRLPVPLASASHPRLVTMTWAAAHVDDELFFRLDGSSFPVEYWVSPILRGGKLQSAVCTFIGVSERGARRTCLLPNAMLDGSSLFGIELFEIGDGHWLRINGSRKVH
jgi:Putative zinc-binding metallo-peptidase/zinc-ribbon domain